MREVDVAKARTHFSGLLKAVEQGGETVLITRNGLAVAKLEPLGEPKSSRTLGKLSGMDLTERFRSLCEQVAQANSRADEPTGKT